MYGILFFTVLLILTFVPVLISTKYMMNEFPQVFIKVTVFEGSKVGQQFKLRSGPH